MAQTIEFLRERIREAAEEARNATLDNVRERALRSEAAWQEMADRATAVAHKRAERADEIAESVSAVSQPLAEPVPDAKGIA